MKHADDCVYPQAQLWSLCTCDARKGTPRPRQQMQHDPLCESYSDEFCSCPLIAQVREEERKAAGARVEAVPYRDHGRTVNRRAAILAALSLPYSKAM